MTLLAILILVFCSAMLCLVVWFMRDIMAKNHQMQQELMYATTDRVIVVVKETAKAVSEAIAPPAPVEPIGYETNPNVDKEFTLPEMKQQPWYLKIDGEFGTDPTDNIDEWLTGMGGDVNGVNRVANIRPGEEIVPGPNVPTTLPGWAQPNMAGEEA